MVLWKLNREIGMLFINKLRDYINKLIQRSILVYVLIIEDFINCLRKEINYFDNRICEYEKNNDKGVIYECDFSEKGIEPKVLFFLILELVLNRHNYEECVTLKN